MNIEYAQTGKFNVTDPEKTCQIINKLRADKQKLKDQELEKHLLEEIEFNFRRFECKHWSQLSFFYSHARAGQKLCVS